MLPDSQATAYYLFSLDYFRAKDETKYPSRCVPTWTRSRGLLTRRAERYRRLLASSYQPAVM
jgi:hypothetical protein